MKIIREGKEIELTKEELEDAYWEQKYYYMVEDVAYNLPGWSGYDSDEKYEGIVNRLRTDKDFCNHVVWRYDELIGDVIAGEDELNCWELACEYALSNNKL